MNNIDLPNFGILLADIPKDLLKEIKKEVKDIKSRKKYTTGISSNKIAKHYSLLKTKPKLDEFLKICLNEYEKRYNYILDHASKTLNRKNIDIIFTEAWFNIQKKGEFLSNHFHDGILSYSLWIDIPFENNLDETNEKFNSCFELMYTNIIGKIVSKKIFVDKSWEGKIILFPSTIVHCVYPFFKTKGDRVSVSGNMVIV
jgi:hypothetical protein